ncbi:MAG: type II secretion system protein [Bacillota bacterium]|nr:type II secretion system protein [Bacillota bacterium]
MKKTMNKRGLTLIEVILAMAILAIVATMVFPVFSSAFTGIMRSGDISDSAFRTSSQIELVLLHRDQDNRTTDLMEITLDGVTYTPRGHIEQATHQVNNSEVSITFFFPGR